MGDAARTDRTAPGGAALVILDMINPLDFDGSGPLVEAAEAAAQVILELRQAADRLEVPVIYVNDNHGEWHSDRSRIIERCQAPGVPGRKIAQQLEPRPGDFFVIKPEFSGFYATNLPVLLPKLGVSRIVLTGVASDVCVLFTAAGAHMRAYELWIPSNAVAGEEQERTRWALEIMAKAMSADTRAHPERRLDDFAGEGRPSEVPT